MKKVIVLILLAFGLYTGYVFGRPYLNYLLFHRDVSGIAINYDTFRDKQDIRQRIIDSAAENSIPLKEEDIDIAGGFNEKERAIFIAIKVHYVVPVSFFGSERLLEYDVSVARKQTTKWAM